MATANVARDMDVLRRALGDTKLSYLGFSYGSYLGNVYANLFPDRVRALTIDGVLDPVAWAGTAQRQRPPDHAASLRRGRGEGPRRDPACAAARPGRDCGMLAAAGDP